MHSLINSGFAVDESSPKQSPFQSHRRTLPLNIYGKAKLNIEGIPDMLRMDALSPNLADETNIFSLRKGS